MHWTIIGGALSAILLVFPLAAVCALLFRFPIPFGSYESGWSAVPHAGPPAVRFYGSLGGFISSSRCWAALGGVLRTASDGPIPAGMEWPFRSPPRSPSAPSCSWPRSITHRAMVGCVYSLNVWQDPVVSVIFPEACLPSVASIQ